MSLPSGYTRLEYIESSGTQYIDTGFRINYSDNEIEIDYQIVGNGNYMIMGAGRTSAGDFWLYNYPNGSTMSAYIYDVNGSQKKLEAYPMGNNTSDNNRHKIKLTYEGTNHNIYTDGILSNSLFISTISSSKNTFLFAAPDYTGYYSHCRIYSFRLKYVTSGTLRSEMIPCKNASNVVGMYDIVRNQFYTNSGTGTFTAGPTDFGVKIKRNSELSCTTIKYNYKVARNMIADGSYGQTSGCWATPNVIADGGGYKSWRYFRNDTSHATTTQKLPALYSSHQYYFACRYRSTNSTSGCILVRSNSASSGDIAASNIWLGASGSSWILSSAIFSPPSNTSSGAADVCMWCGNGTFDSCKYILIDLTDTFGSGYEPSKSWCDNNIREHEVWTGYGNVSSTVTTSNYTSAYSLDGWSSSGKYNYLGLDSNWEPREYMYNMNGNTSRDECYINSTIVNALTPSNIHYGYMEVHSQGTIAYPHVGMSYDFYFPVAEPLLGQVPFTASKRFNVGGGGALDWRRISCVNNRSSFSSGNYAHRFDLNNLRTSQNIRVTALNIANFNSPLAQYNAFYGTSVAVGNLTKHWGDCWLDIRSSPFIHIGDPRQKKIIFDDQHNVICNGVEIRPETSNLKFTSTGKIICSNITTNLNY